jgi:ABC-2 type transport system permease protein
MSAYLSIYKGYFKTALAVQFQYRAAMIIWLIGGVVEPLMYLVVWTTVATQQGGTVGSFTAGGFAAYYIAMMLVNHFTFSWIMWEYDYRIRSGDFSALLLKPIHPIHSDIADNLGYKVLTLIVYLPAVGLLTWFFQPTFTFVGWAVVATIPVLILAFLMRFFLEWGLAMSAFWTTRTGAVNQVYFVLLLFFSGRLAPLELFPQPVQTLAAALPFRWMLAFPVELALGRLTTQEAFVGIGVQLAWIVIGFLLMRTVYRAGIRRYSAFGS